MNVTSVELGTGGTQQVGAGQRLRVAMVAACPFPLRRGTPVRIFRIAEALALRGHDVHVVTYHLGDEVSGVPFHVHRIPVVPGYRKLSPGPSYRKLFVLDPLLRRTLRALLARQAFDLVHAHHYEGLLIAHSLPRRGRPPIVYDAHTLLGSELPYYSLGVSTRFKRAVGVFMDRKLPGRATHVIAVTDALRDRLVEIGAVAADRITVIGSGVEQYLFDVPAAPRPAGSTVVFAGNLAAYQGIEFLLRAFQQVWHRRRDVRLRIITDSEFHAYEALACDLGIREHLELVNVAFEQLPFYLRAADVAVNPRVSCEGIPQKVMNYMAAGCPIVSFAGSAVHLQHGITGWIVPDADVAAMADGILSLLDDPALGARLGGAARARIVQEFSWDRIAERVEAVYGRLLGIKPVDRPPVRVRGRAEHLIGQHSAPPVPLDGPVVAASSAADLPSQTPLAAEGAARVVRRTAPEA
jgi:glycosyltransferase involved in cell wall biosynthesis